MFSSKIVTDKSLLHRKSAPYEFNDDHHPDLLSAHIKKMVKENNAFGISGVQFNYPFRVFGIYTTDSKFEVLFNPELVSIADETLISEEEGCLSFPNLILKIKRPKRVSCKAPPLSEALEGGVPEPGFGIILFPSSL